MHICHVATGDLWAGAEVQLFTLMGQFRQIEGLNVSAVLFNEGRLAHELRRTGIDVSVFPEATWTSAHLAWALRQYFRARTVSILHTHKYKDTVLAAPTAWACGVPHVVRTIHGLREPFAGARALKMDVYEALEGWVHRLFVHRVIAVSGQVQSALRQSFDDQTLQCIQNGIAVEPLVSESVRQHVRRKLGVTPGCRLIGAVGRLTPVKGLEYLLRAFQMLRQDCFDVRLVLIGEGPLRGVLVEQVKEMGMLENVALLGHRDDTHELMAALDLLVMPSLSEGIPMALLEGMANERPVVASRVGGIPEVVEDGLSGLLVRPSDSMDLAEKCRRVLENPNLAQALGHAARRRVQAHFSAESMAERTLSLYRELAEANGSQKRA